MPIDDDLSMSLPKPPPPHPARKEAAIEAALRRFDGTDEAPAAADRPRAAPPWWTRLRQPQFGVALSAVIVLAVGLPAALIAIRDRSPAPMHESVAPPVSPSPQANPPADNASPAERAAPTAPSPAAKAPPATVAPEPGDRIASPANDEPAKEAPPPPAMYAPAPPPPPAAQAAPVVAESGANQQAVGELIVTGTRMAQPSPERAASKAARSADAAEQAPADAADNSAYENFVTRLQTAIRANDRGAVIKLIGFPLRVNSSGRSRFYPNARSVQRDFDRIFTPRVRQAILVQRPAQLFTRDQGAMIGDGEIWFDHSCLNSRCTALGPVRITAVNP